MTDAQPQEVAHVINSYAPNVRLGVLRLREMIFDIAAELDGVGTIDESLRWGQPAYLTNETRSGTTLRLGPHKQASFAVFVHCQTNVIHSFASQFPGMDRIDGNRAILFDSVTTIDPTRHGLLIRHALTYHLTKRF